MAIDFYYQRQHISNVRSETIRELDPDRLSPSSTHRKRKAKEATSRNEW